MAGPTRQQIEQRASSMIFNSSDAGRALQGWLQTGSAVLGGLKSTFNKLNDGQPEFLVGYAPDPQGPPIAFRGDIKKDGTYKFRPVGEGELKEGTQIPMYGQVQRDVAASNRDTAGTIAAINNVNKIDYRIHELTGRSVDGDLADNLETLQKTGAPGKPATKKGGKATPAQTIDHTGDVAAARTELISEIQQKLDELKPDKIKKR